MGRLVSDKGCDLLFQALERLQREDLYPSVSIIGDGPERKPLERLASAMGLSKHVEFLGTVIEGRGREIARHKIMVIPSRWNEPFGLVALEGIAAGCAIVASARGGLPEAIGPCGLLFSNGDVNELIVQLKRLILDDELRRELVANAQAHLREFDPNVVANRYLQFFEEILLRRG